MKILALQGSPRAAGNTDTVLKMVLASAEAAGAKVETVHIAKLEALRGCLECFGCQKTRDKPGCVVKDDMRAVMKKAMQADVIVWATPVFCWSPAWPLKIVMDRFFCTFKFDEDHKVTSLLKGRRMAAVITSGGGKDDGADLVTETLKRTAKFSQAKWLGALVAANAESPKRLRADQALARRAAAFGKRLAKKTPG